MKKNPQLGFAYKTREKIGFTLTWILRLSAKIESCFFNFSSWSSKQKYNFLTSYTLL